MMEFARTMMGHRFFESHVPSLVEQLKRLNENIASVVKLYTDGAITYTDGAVTMRPRVTVAQVQEDDVPTRIVKLLMDHGIRDPLLTEDVLALVRRVVAEAFKAATR